MDSPPVRREGIKDAQTVKPRVTYQLFQTQDYVHLQRLYLPDKREHMRPEKDTEDLGKRRQIGALRLSHLIMCAPVIKNGLVNCRMPGKELCQAVTGWGRVLLKVPKCQQSGKEWYINQRSSRNRQQEYPMLPPQHPLRQVGSLAIRSFNPLPTIRNS